METDTMKNNKPNNNVEQKLKEIGMTPEQVREWLGQEKKAASNSCQTNFSFFDTVTNKSADCDLCGCSLGEQLDTETDAVGTVAFAPYNFTRETEAYILVGGKQIPIAGVIRAVLDYDSRHSTPVLKLEILDPTIL